MTQKLLAGRADDPNLNGDLVRVKVDQVVLARDPDRTLSEPALVGAKKCAVEVGIAYDTRCVTALSDTSPGLSLRGARDALNLGMLIARPGIGFPAAVHLERSVAQRASRSPTNRGSHRWAARACSRWSCRHRSWPRRWSRAACWCVHRAAFRSCSPAACARACACVTWASS